MEFKQLNIDLQNACSRPKAIKVTLETYKQLNEGGLIEMKDMATLK